MNTKHSSKSIRRCFFFVIIIFVTANCVSYYRHHDQNKAAQVALDFSANAFVKQDFEKAYSFLRSDTAEEFNVLKLRDLVSSMHPENKYPVELKADEYEVIPNSGKMKIYLQGNVKDHGSYYYCIVTVPERGDYKVSEIYRNKENSPYPTTSLRKSLSEN